MRRFTRRLGAGCALALSLLLPGCVGQDEGPRASNGAAPPAAAVHSPSEETLLLPSLRSGQWFYTDVQLRLATDGTWQLLSATLAQDTGHAVSAWLEPGAPLESIASRSEASVLTVSRLHRGSTLHDITRIRLQGSRWTYDHAGAPAVALSAQDFAANTGLVADASHVVSLHTGPSVERQRFPVHLTNGDYRLCAEAGSTGSDRVTIFDSTGQARASVTTGEPCKALTLPPGRYAIEHEFMDGDTHRPVFFWHRDVGGQPMTTLRRRPATAAAGAQSPMAADLSIPVALGSPEYWAFAPSGATGLIGAAEWGEHAFGCPGWAPFTLDLFNDSRLWLSMLFRVDRDASGVPVALKGPASCDEAKLSTNFNQGLGVGWDGENTVSMDFVDGYFSLSSEGGPIGLEVSTLDLVSPFAPKTLFQPKLRYYPGGIDATRLPAGSVALYHSSNTCSGPAVVVDRQGMPSMQIDAGQNWFPSMRLGPHTTAVVYESENYGGASQRIASTDCLTQPFSGAISWRAGSLQVVNESVDLVLAAHGCPQCNLSGLNFTAQAAATGQACDLSGVDFTGANLSHAVLTSCNLSGANLRDAILQGATLNLANLGGARMCNALLNAAETGVAAQLVGASLHNANLSQSNLSGANFSYASFHADRQQDASACTAACGAAASTCASASGATAIGTNFGNAYLAGLNLSSATARGARFHKAVLFGASLRNADLRRDAAGTATDFSNAYLQGADFGDSLTTGASFSSAYTDRLDAVSTKGYVVELTAQHTEFTGFRTPDSRGECVPASDATTVNRTAAQIYLSLTVLPPTDASNVCADGRPPVAGSSCSDASWTAPLTPLTGASPRASLFRVALPPFPNKCGYAPAEL